METNVTATLEQIKNLNSCITARMQELQTFTVYKLIIIGLCIISIVFALFLQKWITVLSIGLIALSYLYIVIRNTSVETIFLNKVSKDILQTKESLISISAIIEEYENKIAILKTAQTATSPKQAKDIISSLTKKVEALEEAKTHLYGRLLQCFKTFQRLDSVTRKFGKECQSFIHEEVEDTLDTCGFAFIDYNGENEDFFDIEMAPKLTEVQQVHRAIKPNKSNDIALKGKLFMPN